MTIILYIPIVIAIIAAINVRKFINTFLNTGTTTAHSAKTLEELNLRRWWIFYSLLKQNVIVEIHRERYYLNEENLAEYLKRKRKLALIIFTLLMFILLVLMFLSQFKI